MSLSNLKEYNKQDVPINNTGIVDDKRKITSLPELYAIIEKIDEKFDLSWT